MEVSSGSPSNKELKKVADLFTRIHVFADLQPYICTFEACELRTTHFPSREAWAEHEFSKHRLRTWWDCPECDKKLPSAIEWEQHLDRDHKRNFPVAVLKVALEVARSARYSSIEKEECPLCRVIVGKPRRLFVKHVGRHMEEIALMALPRDADDESNEGSSNTSDISPSRTEPQVSSPSTPTRSLAQHTVTQNLASDPHLSDVVNPKVLLSTGRRRTRFQRNKHTLSDGLPSWESSSTRAGFRCPELGCEKWFSRNSDLQRHMKKHNLPSTLAKLDCPGRDCGRQGAHGFDREDHMSEHLRNYHRWDVPRGKSIKGSGYSLMNTTIDGNTTLQRWNDSAKEDKHSTVQSPSPQTQNLKPRIFDNDLILDRRLLSSSKPINDTMSKDPDKMGSELRPQLVSAVASASSDWSLSERQTFYELTKRFGTDFQAIADIMKTKTPEMVSIAD